MTPDTVGPNRGVWGISAPLAAAAGSVSSHARARCPAMLHRTDAALRAAPAPKIEPVATWVVDSGNPRCEEARMTVAALVLAAKPGGGSIAQTRMPTVWMIRHPPM